ncbi:Trp biosynthesis-associated membrane protein [Aestuariimicrobium soli]|uniref:Trp biosynthesis-associated membrane protein n=1 Tax=Aestuariimicrobium soli TaxID=2035834 RepID=UPI003EBCA858
MTVKRWHAAACWALAAVVAAVAGQQSWARDATTGVAGASISGADATGGLVTTLAWSGAALALLLLVLRRPGTRVIGVLAVLIGAGALLAAVLGSYPAAAELSPSAAAQVVASRWRWAFASSALVLAVGGVVAVVTAPQADRRRPSRYTRADPAELGGDAWKAMDAGDDPTADPR